MQKANTADPFCRHVQQPQACMVPSFPAVFTLFMVFLSIYYYCPHISTFCQHIWLKISFAFNFGEETLICFGLTDTRCFRPNLLTDHFFIKYLEMLFTPTYGVWYPGQISSICSNHPPTIIYSSLAPISPIFFCSRNKFNVKVQRSHMIILFPN